MGVWGKKKGFKYKEKTGRTLTFLFYNWEYKKNGQDLFKRGREECGGLVVRDKGAIRAVAFSWLNEQKDKMKAPRFHSTTGKVFSSFYRKKGCKIYLKKIKYKKRTTGILF